MNRQSAIKGTIIVMTALCPVVANAQDTAIEKNNNQTENTMSTIQKNKEIVMAVYEQALNKKQMQILSQLISEKFEVPGGKRGAEGFQVPVKEVIEAFPDAQWHLRELIGEGNKVFVRWDWEGTHLRAFKEFPATNKKVTSKGVAVFELEDGKVIKANVMTDRFSFFQGLGAIPEDLGVSQPINK
jgi:steroid delta-isomerase-like uncharacterized protein